MRVWLPQACLDRCFHSQEVLSHPLVTPCRHWTPPMKGSEKPPWFDSIKGSESLRRFNDSDPLISPQLHLLANETAPPASSFPRRTPCPREASDGPRRRR